MTFVLVEDPQNEKVFKATRKMPKNVKIGIKRGAWISGQELVKDTRRRMTLKDKTGRVYKVYVGIGGRKLKRPRNHTASAPGQYPAVITGDLRSSVDFLASVSRLEFGMGNEKVTYANKLEETRQPLGQTVRRLENKVNKNITREINKLIKVK